MSWLPSLLRHLYFGRLLVIAAGAIGLFFFLFSLVVDDGSLYRSFLEGAGAGFATMVVGGTAERFWGVKFARATRKSLRVAVDGVLSQMDAVNARLLSLEEDVAALKADPPGQGSEMQPRS